MELKFYGHSDDCFCVESVCGKISEEIYAKRGVASYCVMAGDAGLWVVGTYDPPGSPEDGPPCWSIGLQQLGKGIALPHWGVKYGTHSNMYSPILFLDVPDNAVVSG